MSQSPRLRAISCVVVCTLLIVAPRASAERAAPPSSNAAATKTASAKPVIPSPDPDGDAPAALVPPPPMSAANGPDWAFGNPVGELFVTLGSALTLATIAIPQRATGWAPSSHAKDNPTLGRISDFTGNIYGTGIAMLGGYGLEVTYYSQNGADSPWVRALRTSLIEAEAVAATSGITFALKSLTGRCRPRAYDNGVCLDGQSDAFPSGHTASISAVAGVRLVNAIASKGKSGARYASFALAEAASVATAALRVGSGAHSWEDVAAAWGIGHVTGAAFALMHKWLPVPAAAVTVPVIDLPGAAHATELPLAAPSGPVFGGSWTFHF